MTVRRLNYTSRKRIRQRDVSIAVHQVQGSPPEFEASVLLESYRLPGDALIYVEAYRQTSWMRFEFGTVSKPAFQEPRKLNEFDSMDAILFRVRVTSSGDASGLLLAEADGIRPSGADEFEEKRVPLLPVKPDDELGQEIYKIDFTADPILLINAKINDWRSLVQQPAFVGLVFPAVLRQVLNRILKEEEHTDFDDLSDWRSRWLRFCISFGAGSDIPEASDDDAAAIDDWIDSAVSAFCSKKKVLTAFRKFWSEDD